MRWQLLTFVCFSVVAITGCAVNALRDDQDRLRSALLELCTDQVMDNLVRASNGLPIIHLDYTNANAQVTVDVNGSLGETAASTHSNSITAIALRAALITRTFANTITSSLGLSRTNQVAATATPVTTSNQVYDAYLSFLTIPGSLRVTTSPPPPGAAHICERFRDEYYWIPVEFRDQYFELAGITTAQRSKSLLPPDDFYSVELIGFGTPDEINKMPNVRGATLVLVKTDRPVPIRSDGQATFDNGRCLRISRYEKEIDHRIDFVSDKFYLALDPTENPDFPTPETLQFPIPVRLYLQQPPPAPTTKDLIERIPFRTPQVKIGSGAGNSADPSPTPPPPSPCPTGREGRLIGPLG
jgi:hypothetical protein